MDAKLKYFWIIFLIVLGLFWVLSVGCSPEGKESHSSHSAMEANAINSISLFEEGQSAIQVPADFHQG